MNELNECIELLGLSRSLDRRNRKFFVHIVEDDLKILLTYFVHTLTFKRLIAYV